MRQFTGAGAFNYLFFCGAIRKGADGGSKIQAKMTGDYLRATSLNVKVYRESWN